ncbi:MAG: lactonase family protein [Ferruginibacter sp.]|nr:lactonase family protein [Ferruginibacter sp.]
MSARIFFLFLFISNSVFAQPNMYLLVGTYTSGKSEGIYVYNFNPVTADHSLISTVKTDNPSYLAVAPNQKTVYAVTENADSTQSGIGGAISAFSFNKDKGSLTLVNSQFSGGKHPCYVAIDKTGKWVFAANYNSGNAALLPVNEDGSLGAVKQVMQDAGNGPNKKRQEGPHVHSTVVSPDNKFLFVPDLGIDKVMIYRFDPVKGTLAPGAVPFARSVAGSGPRHFDFHPNNRYAYLMEEMTGTVVAFKYSGGKLDSIQRTSALPRGFNGVIGSADIHVSPGGKFLYCSNRGGSNSITIFKINNSTGKLTVAGYQSTMGKTPRNFNFDPSGNFLLVANQQSDDIVIFKIDKKTGLLTDTGKRINVPNPVCIKWITN